MALHGQVGNPVSTGRSELLLPDSFSLSVTDTTLSVLYDQVTGTLLVRGLDDWLKNHPADTLYLRYRYYPFVFQKEYRRYALGKTPTDANLAVSEQPTGPDFFQQWRSDRKLRKSGSFVRGVTLGSNRDLAVNSGFRLELEGQLTDDVEIAAILTDENLPIQPEGNTQTLQEIDQVYIRLKHPIYQMTLGDYQVTRAGYELSSYTRKLQGLDLQADWSTFRTGLGFANMKGIWTSNTFNGTDGSQGPYRLRGKKQEKFILVLAGSERVYLNGVQLTRGESNDYVIDYASGEISFTPANLITSASRVTVDFEYSDRQFARDFYSGEAGIRLSDGAFQSTIHFLREADNPNTPVEAELTRADRDIIRQAGNDQTKAFRSGIDSVGREPVTGKSLGFYLKADTLTTQGLIAVYRYAPGHPMALYNIRFSEVEQGRGSYIRRSIGVYEWTQSGGNYEPVYFLPVPVSSQSVNSRTIWTPIAGLKWINEWSVSSVDRNLLSEGSNEQSNDGAVINRLSWNSDSLSFPGLTAARGVWSVSGFQRYQGAGYQSPDRNQDVDFYRNLGVDPLESSLERQWEAGTSWQSKTLTLQTSYSRFSRGNDLSTDQIKGQISQYLFNPLFTDYRVNVSKSRQSLSRASTRWTQHALDGDFRFEHLSPFFSGLYENRENRGPVDSLLTGSFRAVEGTGGLRLTTSGYSANSSLKVRNESEPVAGSLTPSASAWTGKLEARTLSDDPLTGSLMVTHYRKYFTKPFREQGNQNTEATLVDMSARWAPFDEAVVLDWDYQVNTQKTSRMDRFFVKVQPGYGNYIWVDRNENGIPEDNEFELTRFDDGDYILRTYPGETLEPIVDLKTQWRLNLNPSLHPVFSVLPDEIRQRWTSETVLRIEEKSKTSRVTDIYFLNLSTFFKEPNTLSGLRQLIQDFYLDPNNRLMNWRFRYETRKSLVQYSIDSEKRRYEEYSIRLNARPWQNWTTRTDAGFSVTGYESASGLRPDFLINSLSVVPDVSYRFLAGWEAGLKSNADYRWQSGRKDQNAFILSETGRLIWSIPQKGRLRAEGEWSQTSLKSPEGVNQVPYELTNGNPGGRLLRWSFFFDYQVSQMVTAFFTYDGRKINEEPVIHTLKAEVRAIF
ncbi:MAG: hypothetical protein HUU10_00145 [Bacteroidetes bacterium]|nr:hypothetical protein [Bacteroidota bacterium]